MSQTARGPRVGPRPWKPLPPFDARDIARPLPPGDNITNWPATSTGGDTAAGDDAGARRVPALLEDIRKKLRKQRSAVDALTTTADDGATAAAAATATSLPPIHAQQRQGSSSVALAVHGADDDDLAAVKALSQLAALRDATAELKRGFKTYRALYEDFEAVIDAAAKQVKALATVNRDLRADYAVAEHGAAEMAKRFAVIDKEKGREAATLRTQLEEVRAAHEPIFAQRREITRLNKDLQNLARKLERVEERERDVSGQNVAKSVAISHLENDLERSHELLEIKDRAIADRDAQIRRLKCDIEVITLAADRRFEETAADLTQARSELATVKAVLASTQRQLDEHGPLSPGVASPGPGFTHRSTGRRGQPIELEFDWSKLCENKTAHDFYEILPDGSQGRHLSDMCPAERVKHILSMWRKARTYLKHADDFIAANGLVRDASLTQDFAAATDPERLDAPVLAESVLSQGGSVLVVEGMRQPVLRPVLYPFRPAAANDGLMAAEELYFQAVDVPPAASYMDASVGLPKPKSTAPPAPAAPSFMNRNNNPSNITADASGGNNRGAVTPQPPAQQQQQPPQAPSAASLLPPVKGHRIGRTDASEEVLEVFAFFRRARKSNTTVTMLTAFETWLKATKHAYDVRKRVGFAYSLWHAIERDIASTGDEAPIELVLFVALYLDALPMDFLEDYDALVEDLRAAFRRRASRTATLNRAALMPSIRRVLPWYETEDLDSLMNAAEATIPFGATGVFEEEPLFAPQGQFLKTLCLQHVCNTLSIKKAMLAAVQKIVSTPATAVLKADGGTGVASSPTAAGRRGGGGGGGAGSPRAPNAAAAPGEGKPSLLGGRRKSMSSLASAALQQQRSSSNLQQQPQQQQPDLSASMEGGGGMGGTSRPAKAAEMVRYSDLFKALAAVDPDKPPRELHAFLGKALGWDLQRYGVLPSRGGSAAMRTASMRHLMNDIATPKASSSPTTIAIGAADSPPAAAALPGDLDSVAGQSQTLDEILAEDVSEEVPSNVESEVQAVLRKKALVKELNERWVDKALALAAIAKVTVRRVTPIPSFPYVRDLPRTVYGITQVAPPAPPTKSAKQPAPASPRGRTTKR